MKKLLFALAFCGFAPRLATAQEVKIPVVLERVLYSRAIPKGLRAFVPRGGKSRFWGATNLKYNGQKVWVHVYDVKKAKASKTKEGDLFGTQKSGLDLFTLSNSRRLKQISSTRFDYKRYNISGKAFGPQSIGIETLWLDPKVQKMPIIRIVLHGTQGYMLEDKSVLVIFIRGLRDGIVQQGFGSGASGGGASGGSWYTDFDQIDGNGLLRIRKSYSTVEGTQNSYYQWKGNKFVESGGDYVAREQ